MLFIWGLCGEGELERDKPSIENFSHLEQLLQVMWLLVPQVEETISRVMGMKTEFRAILRHCALGAHHERFITSVAELELALRTSEVHTAAPGQGITEFALGTIDAVDLQMFGHSFILRIRVVILLPLGKLVTGQTLVLLLPLNEKMIFIESLYHSNLSNPLLTDFLHCEQVTEPQSGQINLFCFGLAKNPLEQWTHHLKFGSWTSVRSRNFLWNSS